MHTLFLLPLLALLLLLALGALIAWLVIGLVIMMFELLCWMLSVPLEWLWQRRVEPVASISGHLLAALDFVLDFAATAYDRVFLWRMLIVPLLLTYVVVVFAGVCLLVLIEWLCWLALLMPRAFFGVLGWWHKALLALFSYGLQQPSDLRRLHSERQTTPQPDQRAV